MQFYSLRFILFFSVTFVLFYAIPAKYRKYLIFIASSLFIISFDAVTFILAFITTAVLFGIALKTDRKTAVKTKLYFYTGIAYTVLILLVFRYSEFITDNLCISFNLINVNPGIKSFTQAAGLSFYLFSGISYLIEVQRQNIGPEKNFINFFNFISFFPKFISGPIERPGKLLKQLSFESVFNYDSVTKGIKIAAYGFFLKLVVADLLGRLSDPVFNSPGLFNGFFVITGVIFYSFQIYFDFSGYTYIALGSSLILGINLTDNFNRPYFASSVRDFWSRWHITLSLWIRDYIFLPLAYKFARLKTGFTKPENFSYVLAIMISMTVVGIWHGAGWNFIVWGIIHGIFLSTGFVTKKWRTEFKKRTGFIKYKRINNTTSVLISFFLVSFAWIFFRAADLQKSLNVITRAGTGWDTVIKDLSSIKGYLFYIGYSKTDVLAVILSLLFIFFLEFYGGINSLLDKIKKYPGLLRWLLYYLILSVIILYGSFNKIQNFIYQQF
jgi:alginate O-acetyltransferase complex protein AlgI